MSTSAISGQERTVVSEKDMDKSTWVDWKAEQSALAICGSSIEESFKQALDKTLKLFQDEYKDRWASDCLGLESEMWKSRVVEVVSNERKHEVQASGIAGHFINEASAYLEVEEQGSANYQSLKASLYQSAYDRVLDSLTGLEPAIVDVVKAYNPLCLKREYNSKIETLRIKVNALVEGLKEEVLAPFPKEEWKRIFTNKKSQTFKKRVTVLFTGALKQKEELVLKTQLTKETSSIEKCFIECLTRKAFDLVSIECSQDRNKVYQLGKERVDVFAQRELNRAHDNYLKLNYSPFVEKMYGTTTQLGKRLIEEGLERFKNFLKESRVEYLESKVNQHGPPCILKSLKALKGPHGVNLVSDDDLERIEKHVKDLDRRFPTDYIAWSHSACLLGRQQEVCKTISVGVAKCYPVNAGEEKDPYLLRFERRFKEYWDKYNELFEENIFEAANVYEVVERTVLDYGPAALILAYISALQDSPDGSSIDTKDLFTTEERDWFKNELLAKHESFSSDQDCFAKLRPLFRELYRRKVIKPGRITRSSKLEEQVESFTTSFFNKITKDYLGYLEMANTVAAEELQKIKGLFYRSLKKYPASSIDQSKFKLEFFLALGKRRMHLKKEANNEWLGTVFSRFYLQDHVEQFKVWMQDTVIRAAGSGGSSGGAEK